MANKKRPVPARKKQPVQASGKQPAQATKQQPAQKSRKQPAPTKPTNKQQPAPASRKRPAPAGGSVKKPAGQSASGERARAASGQLVRRIAIVVLALLVVVGVVLAAVSVRNEQLRRKIEFFYSGVLQKDCLFSIDISADQVQERVRDTKRHGPTQAFTFFCGSTLRIEPSNRSGFILFGNPADNDCDLVLTILDENDSLIYRSGGVEPGMYVTKITLSSMLQSGSHACRAYVSGYSREDYNCVGVQYMDLTVEVGGTS